MRAFEFYTKVTESKKETPTADKMAAALNSTLDTIISKVKNQKEKQPAKKSVVKPIPLPSEKPVESLDEAIGDTASKIKQSEDKIKELKFMLQGFDNPKANEIIIELEKDLLDLKKVYAEELKAERTAGGAEEREQNIEFFEKLETEILPKLAEKIESELSKIAAVSPFNPEEQTEKPGIPTKQVGKITTARRGKLENVKAKIMTGLEGVFSRLKRTAVESGPEMKEAIQELLQDFIVGVVDFGDVLKQKQGSIDAMFEKEVTAQGKSKEYKEAFDSIKDTLYKAVIETGKGTNMGPGELGLALILQPASKAGKGDLGYGDEVIELKGSMDPKSGARLGLEMGNKTNQVSSYQSTVLDKHFKGDVKYAYPAKTKTGKETTINLNLTKTGINIINQLIPRYPGFDTKEFLLDSIVLTLDGSEDDKKKWRDMIDKSNLLDPAIASDGTIDYDQWVKALTLIQYDLYGGAEAGQSQFKTIMVFSPNSSNFRVVKTTEEFGKAISDGQAGKPNGIVVSGGLSFNLDKFAKTPQVGIA